MYYAARLMRAWMVALIAFAAGCAPAIGDPCTTSVNCSITGDRVCDAAQPGGACTVFGCEVGTCPAEATCVRWRPMESRLEFTACMRRCESDAGCRVDEGYACLAPADITDGAGAVLAELIDEDAERFCVATEPE